MFRKHSDKMSICVLGGGRGRSGVAKLSCILRHRGVQLILAYCWAMLAILVAGKGRGKFLFLRFLPLTSCIV